ncbi:MAG: hypothetical protein V1778_04535 [bacterium]
MKLQKNKKQGFFRARRVVALLAVFTLVISQAVFEIPTAHSAAISPVAANLQSSATGAETQITVTWTPATALAVSDVIQLYLGPSTGGVEFTDGDADQSGTDIDCTQSGSTFNSGTFAAASATTPMLYTITVAGVSTGAGEVVCTLGAASGDGPNLPVTADGYSVAVVTNDDTGAGIDYVGSGNLVTVSASVLPNLTLTIDNSDGTTCTTTSGVTSCSLGLVTTAAVNTGNYDVNVGTNAASGATLKIAEDGDLRNNTDTIDDVVEDTGGTVTAGVEEYGIAVVSDAAWTEQGNFTDDDTPIPSGPATVATTAAPIAASGDDVTITHRVAVSSATKALTYSHIVTWTATATF